MRQVKVTYRVDLEVSATGRPLDRVLNVTCGCAFQKKSRYNLEQESEPTHYVNATVVDIDRPEFRVNARKQVRRNGVLRRLPSYFDIETPTRWGCLIVVAVHGTERCRWPIRWLFEIKWRKRIASENVNGYLRMALTGMDGLFHTQGYIGPNHPPPVTKWRWK